MSEERSDEGMIYVNRFSKIHTGVGVTLHISNRDEFLAKWRVCWESTNKKSSAHHKLWKELPNLHDIFATTLLIKMKA